MKNKGFTLIELLGVVVILGIVAAFSVPALTKTFKNTADKQYKEFAKSIELAAENYFHNELDGDLSTRRFISVGELVRTGYLKKEINPLTEKEVSESATIVVSKNADGTESYVFVDRNVTETGYSRNGLIVLFDGYHNFENGQWIDLSGKGNNGTVYGAIWDKDHIYFDGINDYVSIGQIDNPNITMELVVKITEKKNWTMLMGNIHNGGCGILVRTDGTQLSGHCYLGSTYEIFDKDYEINNIYNVSLSYDGKQLMYYINNSLIGQYASTAGIKKPDNNTIFMLGANPNGTSIDPDALFSGNIYSVRIYNRALTNEELYNNYIVDKYRFGIE